MDIDATLYLGSLYVWRRIRASARQAATRWKCGRRTGHFPVTDWLGNQRCSRCRSWMP